MINADFHVHSDFSSDSKATMEQMIEQAIILNLKKLCFTDHMDYDYPVIDGLTFVFDPEEYIRKLDKMKEKYHGKIELLTGIELGLQPHLKEQLSSLVQNYPFDFVIGSSHMVNHIDPYYPEFWENKTKEQGIQEYLESIIENCKVFHDFHVYGHLDYIIRYVPAKANRKEDYNFIDYADLFDEVLKTLIMYDVGIEINTSAYKYGLGHAHPKLEVMKRYRELGGEIITIGSDAHKPEHLCYDFHLIPELLKSVGFRYYATFMNGKPIYEKL